MYLNCSLHGKRVMDHFTLRLIHLATLNFNSTTMLTWDPTSSKVGFYKDQQETDFNHAQLVIGGESLVPMTTPSTMIPFLESGRLTNGTCSFSVTRAATLQLICNNVLKWSYTSGETGSIRQKRMIVSFDTWRSWRWTINHWEEWVIMVPNSLLQTGNCR